MPPVFPDPLQIKAKLFRGLADPARLSVLECLRAGPKCVSDLIPQTGLSQSNVSNHLACLRDCGLVLCERRGRFIFYRLAEAGVADLLGRAELLLDQAHEPIGACPNYAEREG